MMNGSKIFKGFDSRIPSTQGDENRRELINWFAGAGLWGGFWSLSGAEGEPRLKKIKELSEPLIKPGQSGIMVFSTYRPINMREIITEEDGISWGEVLNRYAAGFATPDEESAEGIATITDRLEHVFQSRVSIFLRRFAELVDGSPGLMSHAASVATPEGGETRDKISKATHQTGSTEDLLAEIDDLTS